ncbi:MAG: HAMP domain-containing histidine kinase [Treponema sp.]|nr:HAMP domain-containing histidine kinase [Treponema sp.]
MGRNKYRDEKERIRERKRDFHLKKMQLKQQYHERLYAEWKNAYHPDDIHYRLYHRHIRYVRPVFLGVMILFWSFLFLFGGLAAGIRIIAALFAVISTASGITELVFLLRMDIRVLLPLSELETAARKIAAGDFDVNVSIPRHPEMESFVNTFNSMAQSLRTDEQLKKEYEENRKDLIAGISHDLKTPVTAVLGYIDALYELAPGDRELSERYLSIIRSNTVYLNRLIDDLFLFSKLDIHKLDFNFETVVLNDYLRDLMEEFLLDLEEHGVHFVYHDMLPAHTTARLDPKRFCRIVRNIIDNARRYNPGNGLEITVSASLEQPASAEQSSAGCPPADRETGTSALHAPGSFLLSIADNGTGIPEEKLAHIFERFYRADSARTKYTEGTGLGLAIARELVEAHGGTISARNVPSGGLVFDIRVPLPESDTGTGTSEEARG